MEETSVSRAAIAYASQGDLVHLVLDRPESRNSLTRGSLEELHRGLARAENDPRCRCVVLQGRGGYFCTGMDFQEFAQASSGPGRPGEPSLFMGLLKRISLFPKAVLAKVEGEVMAGGVGLAAACDLVIASPGSRFSLSEALWGLAPAMVMPYLIRRIGFQKAYAMTLTTLPIDAEEARRIHLADEVGAEPDVIIRRYLLRLRRVEPATVADLKRYFRKLWIIDQAMEEEAVREIETLAARPQVQANIRDFMQQGIFPWEKGKSANHV